MAEGRGLLHQQVGDWPVRRERQHAGAAQEAPGLVLQGGLQGGRHLHGHRLHRDAAAL